MNGLRKFGTLAVCLALLTPLGLAQQFSRYRDFDLGMSVNSVTKQIQVEPAQTRTLFTTPDLIQTLQWERQDYFSSADPTDPVRSMRFDFFKDQLARIIVIYGSRQIQGMTAADVIERVSETYGPSTKSDETVDVSAYAGYEDRQKVLARWEDGETSYSLFRSSYGGEYGLLISSKKLQSLSAVSLREARRLDTAAAPQRELDRLQKEAENRRAAEEKTRSVNKPNFRP
jgi:hypothetical protein